MSKNNSFIITRFLYVVMGILLIGVLTACNQDRDITARTTIEGFVNDSAVKGEVLANFNTGTGGSSTCTFSLLPENFLPSTFGTHT